MEYSDIAFEEKYTYDGSLGALWSQDRTQFRVWAPTASKLSVLLYPDGGDSAPDAVYPMRAEERGTWTVSVEGDLNGVYYTYLVTVGGKTRETIDPYARAGGVNGRRGMVINLAETNPAGWAQDAGPRMPATDAVVWETHIRDFSAHRSSGMKYKGKYLAFTEEGTATPGGNPTGLSYLRKLGVTHVQLLPVYDFGSVDESRPEKRQYNWGYDPVNCNFPEGSYSTNAADGKARIRELKQAIASLHRNGFGVIMDVVYNHVYHADRFSGNILVPGYYSRGRSNGSCCGNDTASERSMVRKFIVDSVCYWAEEYHMDGFRFDIIGIIDTQTVREIQRALHARCPGLLLYGEGWTMNTVPTKPGLSLCVQENAAQVPGFGFFNDRMRDLVRGSVFEPASPGIVSGAAVDRSAVADAFRGLVGWTADPKQVVNYASCHDNATLADRIHRTLPEIDDADMGRRCRLAAAFTLLSQGLPFLLSGEEMLRSKPNGRGGFVENSYRSGDRVNALRWDRLETPECAKTARYYAGLIALRRAYAVFRLSTRAEIAQCVTDLEVGAMCGFLLRGAQMLAVYYNFTDEPKSADLPQGVWRALAFDSEAGTRTLFQAQGMLLVPPLTAAVLVSNRTI